MFQYQDGFMLIKNPEQYHNPCKKKNMNTIYKKESLQYFEKKAF